MKIYNRCQLSSFSKRIESPSTVGKHDRFQQQTTTATKNQERAQTDCTQKINEDSSQKRDDLSSPSSRHHSNEKKLTGLEVLQKQQPEARPFTVDEPCRSQLDLQEGENAAINDEKHKDIAPEKEDLADFKDIKKPVKMLSISDVVNMD